MTAAAPTIEYDVFISYSSSDGAIATVLYDGLKARGFKPWRDRRDINPANNFSVELENAIEASRLVAVCVTGKSRSSDWVRNEIIYAQALKKPVLPLRFEDVLPPMPIIAREWLEFYKDHDHYFETFCEIIKDPTRSKHREVAPADLPPDDVYKAYLETLLVSVVKLLGEKLRLSDFRELTPTVTESPDKVSGTPPRRKKDLASFWAREGLADDEEKPVENFNEGFSKFGGRALLLGEPGAGKTTALLAFARDVVRDRIAHPEKPLPLLARIPSWDSQKQTPIAAWLADETDLDQTTVEGLIRDGQALLLLDALDELGSDREDEKNKERYDPRKRFLSILPDNNQIVVTSRIKDYDDIGEKLPFPGAVTLRPLTDEQIQEYLSGIPGLWEAMKDDDALRDIARTPLLLSLMAFAFQDAPEDVRKLTRLSEGELRDAIFERFVKERYAHEARSGREMAFTLDEIYAHLGALAMANASGSWNNPGVLTEKDIIFRLQNSTDFTALMIGLNLLLPDEKGYRFIHLRLRDYFAYPVAMRGLSDVDGDVRSSAAEALGQIGDVRAVEPLVAALRDPEGYVRNRAAWALGQIGDAQAVEPLIAALRDKDWDVRSRAAEALEKIGKPSVELLIAALRDNNWNVRRSAAYALGKIKDARAVAPLIAALRDTVGFVRRSAANALGQIGEPSVVPLIAALCNEDEHVRSHAAHALGIIGDIRAVKPLIAALRDPERLVRRNAAEALGQIGDEQAVEPLIALLTDTEKLLYGIRVCDAAADALTQIGTREAVEAVRRWQAGEIG